MDDLRILPVTNEELILNVATMAEFTTIHSQVLLGYMKKMEVFSSANFTFTKIFVEMASVLKL